MQWSELILVGLVKIMNESAVYIINLINFHYIILILILTTAKIY
jgi:hypothetical protein